MNRHELEARLNAVREEIAIIEATFGEAAADMEAETKEKDEKNKQIEHRMEAQREARKKQNSTLWGKTRSFFGFDDKPDLPDDYGKIDGVGLFFDVMKVATLLPLGLEAKKRLDELKAEEGKLLDQLEPLTPKAEPTKAAEREKIYDEMAIRHAEWERLRARETDEDRLMRMKNIYDDADARDEERLRRLL